MSCLILTLAAALLVSAQSGPPQQPAPGQSVLPTNAEVQAALSRMLGYDPNITWQIISIRPSQIRGMALALVSINKQAPSQIYISADGKYAIIGELIPFGRDPYFATRMKLDPVRGPALGAQQPAIRIVEFTDLQCAPCVAAQKLLEKLIADFPSAQITYQPFPLPEAQHPWALKAAEYADCVGQSDAAAFWKFVDAVFAAQQEITPANADDKFAAILASIQMDKEKISACAFAPETGARIQKSAELANSLEIYSVPTVFINGRRLTSLGNAPYEQIKAIVKFELDHAGK